MSNSGLGTSSQNFNASGTSNNTSNVSPYAPTVGGLQSIVNQIQPYAVAGLGSGEVQNYQNARNNISQLPNFGPAAAQTASNIFQTGGDPTGLLRSSALGLEGNISNLQPYATQNLDPTKTPGMQAVLDTIKNDISNQVNGQFAGAGRSLSGLNEQTLARGLAQGEAVPLLNQYNQNFANMIGANNSQAGYQGQLGNISQQAMSNLGQGANFAQMAPQLAQLNPMMIESLVQQQRMQPLNYLAQAENMLNPIAGLGGTTVGQQQTPQSGSGTATNSLLSQLGQGLGLLNPLGKFLGTF